MSHLDQFQQNISQLCDEHKVEKLYLFGSATGNDFNEKSDIDLVVKFKPIDLSSYFSNYMDLKLKLMALFNRKVDLLEEQAISNPFIKSSIDATKQLIYG